MRPAPTAVFSAAAFSTATLSAAGLIGCSLIGCGLVRCCLIPLRLYLPLGLVRLDLCQLRLCSTAGLARIGKCRVDAVERQVIKLAADDLAALVEARPVPQQLEALVVVDDRSAGLERCPPAAARRRLYAVPTYFWFASLPSKTMVPNFAPSAFNAGLGLTVEELDRAALGDRVQNRTVIAPVFGGRSVFDVAVLDGATTAACEPPRPVEQPQPAQQPRHAEQPRPASAPAARCGTPRERRPPRTD